MIHRIQSYTTYRMPCIIHHTPYAIHHTLFRFDFSGSAPEMLGNLNAPPSVTTSAVIYTLRYVYVFTQVCMCMDVYICVVCVCKPHF
ncbi:hypothetical protein EON63_17540 [archaeon]|nr:MAG: hypothetical protein EON63_17540 [archaeon]